MTPRNPKIIELELDSGIRVWITPINQHHLLALDKAANEQFPLPDKKAFEEPITEDVAIPGLTTKAEDNPDYVALVRDINARQQEFKLKALFEICVQYPDFPAKQDVIAHFADEITMQRRYLELPLDDWEATWRYAILRTSDDEAAVILAVQNRLPLTEAELTEEIRGFRRQLPQRATRTLPDRQKET